MSKRQPSALTASDLQSLHLKGEIVSVISFCGGWLVFTEDETHYFKPKLTWWQRGWQRAQDWLRLRMGGSA